jgi:hypothetical protein
VRARCLAAALVLLVSCGGSDRAPSEQEAESLADLTLLPDEAPPGLEPDEEATGPIGSLRDVLPPRSDAPQLPPLAKAVRRAFLGGYDAVYAGTEEEGAASLTSTVLRFSESEHASAFLTYLRDVQSEAVTVGSSELLEAPGLGEEGYRWHGQAPGGETSGCVWRRGELVLTLTLGGPLGRAPADRAFELARGLDARLD